MNPDRYAANPPGSNHSPALFLMMNATDRVIRNPALALAPSEDGYLAYDTESRRLHRLNPAAALIVELCDGMRDIAGISAELSPLLPGVDPNACGKWIETALKDGILKTSGHATAAPSSESLAALAQELRQDGEVLAAFVCQDHATLLAPDDSNRWCVLGELAHIVGRRERAREAYERYMTFEPDDAEVGQILVALRDQAPPPRAPDECIEQLYSRFAGFYEKNMCGDLKYQAPLRLNEALDTQPTLAKNLDALELGCGTGLAAPHLRPRARKLHGLDLSPDMLEKARATGLYDELEVAEITAWLARCTASFDLIVACDTLIYFGDLRQVIVPAARLLRPNAFIAFTVERGSTAPYKLTDSGRYSHTESHIRDVARDAGLSVVRLTEGFLRNEYGEPVTGLISLLRRI